MLELTKAVGVRDLGFCVISDLGDNIPPLWLVRPYIFGRTRGFLALINAWNEVTVNIPRRARVVFDTLDAFASRTCKIWLMWDNRLYKGSPVLQLVDHISLYNYFKCFTMWYLIKLLRFISDAKQNQNNRNSTNDFTLLVPSNIWCVMCLDPNRNHLILCSLSS